MPIMFHKTTRVNSAEWFSHSGGCCSGCDRSSAAAAVAGAVDTQRLVSEAARGAPRDEDWLGTFVRRRTKSEKESDERKRLD